MKIEKLIIGILILSLIACKDSKNSQEKTHPPEVEFDFSDMPENVEIKPETYVNDLENLFNKEQNEALEKYLTDLYKNTSKKIYVVTVPFSEESKGDWEIGTNIGGNGLWISFSKAMKDISITPDKKSRVVLTEKTINKIINKVIIPEFENENYYGGVEKGITEILERWK